MYLEEPIDQNRFFFIDVKFEKLLIYSSLGVSLIKQNEQESIGEFEHFLIFYKVRFVLKEIIVMSSLKG
ncbi:hypothetical protein BAGA_17865 [Bacillus gaemokensis]|uniref:Uncharacterized protein n=1 Tax=Bacillus gaemokensis TaxID=574375 RepID=A0A073KCL0_9BACI|nr:hypothetical protein BAGA_17865 [Bacillus gaemokensis]